MIRLRKRQIPARRQTHISLCALVTARKFGICPLLGYSSLPFSLPDDGIKGSLGTDRLHVATITPLNSKLAPQDRNQTHMISLMTICKHRFSLRFPRGKIRLGWNLECCTSIYLVCHLVSGTGTYVASFGRFWDGRSARYPNASRYQISGHFPRLWDPSR